MSRKIEIKVVSYYFDEAEITKFLEKFNYRFDILSLHKLSLPDTTDCMDMSAYYNVFQCGAEKHVIVLNDTLFKKLFWKASLKSLIRLANYYSDISDIPILIGDLHKTADLYSSYHPVGKHISTYAFYCNEPAQKLFISTYESFHAGRIDELLANPFQKVIDIRNFSEIDVTYAWKGSGKATPITHLKKLKAILIELNFSKSVLSNGVIIDIKDTRKNRILHKLRGMFRK